MLVRELTLLFKFGLVGAAGFAVDALALSAGAGLGLSDATARIVSVGVALHVTFLLNGWLVFRALRLEPLLRQWSGYMASNAFGAFCNYALFIWLLECGLPVLSHRLGALAAASILAMGINFVGARFIAFRPSEPASG